MHDLKTEVTLLERKNEKYKTRFETTEQEIDFLKEKLPELNDKYGKLKLLAKKYNVEHDPNSKKALQKKKYLELKEKVDKQ